MSEDHTASRSRPSSPQMAMGEAALAEPAKRFGIIVKMPSDAELRDSSLRWHAKVGPTLLDQWPDEVRALSMPTEMVPFPLELMDPLFEPSQRPHDGLTALAAELDARMGWDRKFVRLNSRSPKDAAWPFQVPATCSGKEALIILGSSERALDDLCYFRHIPEHAAYICLREFVPGMRAAMEYRCFVKDGELIAVTHYDYHNPIPVPTDGGRALREHIADWFARELRPRLHVETVVFDLYLPWEGEPLLIELNPYGLSDPCWLGSYEAVENFSGYVAFEPPPRAEFAHVHLRTRTATPGHEMSIQELSS